MTKRFWQDNSTPLLCVKLGAIVVMMFAFAIFIMPPLYDLFCDITGLNGKTGGPFVTGNAENELGVDTSRTVKVQFLATNNENMPWEFRPQIKTITVHPGEPTVVNYLAVNNTRFDMVAQAVPSLVPFKAANYFHKTECFCFNQQPLAAGESAELGLSFIVDVDIPKNINTITLSYTLFDITESQKKKTTLNVINSHQQLAVNQL
ncbi:cytochrome c oxidase assembly protein [Candidatus Endobugula sertula]|uniref:Cytochrome c oxidase assembly protein CtaG n=1 Tax=Candidatus Endobugula sertula TaxID=62101 RepID=A0A1D2QR45_9GAMM|nr:cytochrome c oxidase assembly protein [Candidatus Endobugula sertula]